MKKTEKTKSQDTEYSPLTLCQEIDFWRLQAEAYQKLTEDLKDFIIKLKDRSEINSVVFNQGKKIWEAAYNPIKSQDDKRERNSL